MKTKNCMSLNNSILLISNTSRPTYSLTDFSLSHYHYCLLFIYLFYKFSISTQLTKKLQWLVFESIGGAPKIQDYYLLLSLHNNLVLPVESSCGMIINRLFFLSPSLILVSHAEYQEPVPNVLLHTHPPLACVSSLHLPVRLLPLWK